MKKNKIDKTIQNKNNRIISGFIVFTYVFIAIFAIITVINPHWLKKASKGGKISEASSLKSYGDVYMDKGDYQKAIIQYDNAIAINPDFAEAYTNMASCYKMLGNYNEAMKYYKKSLTYEDRLHDFTYYYIAEIFNINGKPEEAVRFYLKSAEIAPYPIIPYQKAGEILNNLKRWEQAKEIFNKAIENSYSMKNCYIGMLKENYYLYEDEKVKNTIKQLLEKGSDNVDFSRFDEKIFEKQAYSHPILSSIYNQYGYIYAQTNEMEKALECFQIAVNILPQFTDAQRNLQMAKMQLMKNK